MVIDLVPFASVWCGVGGACQRIPQRRGGVNTPQYLVLFKRHGRRPGPSRSCESVSIFYWRCVVCVLCVLCVCVCVLCCGWLDFGPVGIGAVGVSEYAATRAGNGGSDMRDYHCCHTAAILPVPHPCALPTMCLPISVHGSILVMRARSVFLQVCGVVPFDVRVCACVLACVPVCVCAVYDGCAYHIMYVHAHTHAPLQLQPEALTNGCVLTPSPCIDGLHQHRACRNPSQ